MSASDEQVGGSHYKDMAIQPSEFSQRNRLNWCEANVVKYVCRHRAKNGREDIEKAIHYLQLLLEWEYPNVTDPAGTGMCMDCHQVKPLSWVKSLLLCSDCQSKRLT